MQTVERAGVQFDMCPSCRGVWLDRGELEKLMEAGRSAAAEPPPQGYPPPYPPPQPYRGKEYDPRYHHKKKRGFDLFDIFD
jgi:Zn-finger nucleic acid-binding protein